ncbi:MAG TPA: IS1380 family transposase [Pseudonocardiaceae bacterium]|nr:IS1380 family transposase [Pseudonocardiaceae bacterium]
MGRLRVGKRPRSKLWIGAPDPSLTGVSGMAAITELCEQLDVGGALDAAVGSIKQRARGHSAGQLLVGLAAAQLAGEDHLVGLDRHRADAAGQVLTPVAGLCSTTAAGLARRITDGQWIRVETGVAAVTTRMLSRLPAPRRSALLAMVTIDLDTTDVEVYGRRKQGVAYNYQGQRCGRPHVATWAEADVALAADLLAGNIDPRRGAPGLLRRALAALPKGVDRIQLRADGGYFAVDLAIAAHRAGITFAIGAKRIAALWRTLAGVTATDWVDAIDMAHAQVTVADYGPAWWPTDTRLLIRRVRLDCDQISTDPRARRRRTLHPDQRALPLDELAQADAVYGYSFILTNLDASTPDKAAAVEHWYRHRTEIENIFRDAKHGAALRHLPSGYAHVNRAWMWGALIATSLAGWLHQLTADPDPGGGLLGWGVRDGKAMIATLRHRLICVPGRLIRHAGQLILRLPPGNHLLNEVLTRLRALPAAS